MEAQLQRSCRLKSVLSHLLSSSFDVFVHCTVLIIAVIAEAVYIQFFTFGVEYFFEIVRDVRHRKSRRAMISACSSALAVLSFVFLRC